MYAVKYSINRLEGMPYLILLDHSNLELYKEVSSFVRQLRLWAKIVNRAWITIYSLSGIEQYRNAANNFDISNY